MIGAIIGDLAASSWENDRNGFYRNLVTDRSQLSECGLCMLAAFATGMDRYDFQVFQKEFNDFFMAHSRGIFCSQEWENFFSSGCRLFNKKVSVRIYAACLVLAGWQKYSDEMAIGLSNSLKLDKEGFYASSFATVIWNLRQGKSKNDIVYKLAEKDFRVETILRWHESHGNPSDGQEEDLLYYLNYAWRCFRYSWDFTSAIHEAMRCPDCFDRHLLGMLTGAIAEAMYGCRSILIKEKYLDGGPVSREIFMPASVNKEFEEILYPMYVYEDKKRVFFPKNSSRTNVERQYWTSFEMTGLPETVDAEFRRRLLKAYEPGEESRYGVYLDDGWFYVCRSFVLLARFQLKEIEEGTWKIVRLQKCTIEHSADSTIREVIDCIRNRWFRISEEQGPENLRYCKYYYGETDNPFEQRTPKAKFWHGEKMFITQEIDMSKWIQTAEKALRGMDERHKVKFLSYSKEHQAILIYMSNLYAKWRPYDDQEWISQY